MVMSKQDYDQQLDESKKGLVAAIKELEEFSKTFSSGLSNSEMELKLKSKIQLDSADKAMKDDKSDDEEDYT